MRKTRGWGMAGGGVEALACPLHQSSTSTAGTLHTHCHLPDHRWPCPTLCPDPLSSPLSKGRHHLHAALNTYLQPGPGRSPPHQFPCPGSRPPSPLCLPPASLTCYGTTFSLSCGNRDVCRCFPSGRPWSQGVPFLYPHSHSVMSAYTQDQLGNQDICPFAL